MSPAEIRSLRLKAPGPLALGKRIHEGLPISTVEHFLLETGWNQTQLWQWAHISPATGKRRFVEGRFKDHESERIARIARLFDQAKELLRDSRRAADWLLQDNPRLGGESPIEAAGTELGALEVEALIGRLRHGVY